MQRNVVTTICLFGAFIGGATALITSYLLPHIALVWQISLGVAVAFALAYLFLDRSRVKGTLTNRNVKYGLNSLVMSFVAIAVVVMLNRIVNMHDIKKDVTKNKLHTLSEQTVKVLKGLTADVSLKLFTSPTQTAEFNRVLDKYTAETKKLSVDHVDVDKDPLSVRKYQVKQLGTIVVESAARSARVDNLAGPDDPKFEEKLTNAIIQVAKGDKKKIYFTVGHGERLAADTSREGFSQVKEDLESGRYHVGDLNLLDKSKIPDDAEIIIVAGPKSSFMDHELKLLDGYVKGGGKLLIMVDPTSTPTIKSLIATYGGDWNPKKTIIENNPLQQLAGGNPLTPIVTTYDTAHEITREARQPSIFAITSPVEKSKTAPADMQVTSLFSTGPRSVEANLVGNQVQSGKTDRQGPLSLGLAVSGKVAATAPPASADSKNPAAPGGEKPAEEKPQKEFRVVIVGDADFASNSVRNFGINSDLFQNMLSWLAHEEDLIAIRPKPTDESQFEVTEERMRVVNLASIVISPLALFLMGIGVWLSRRRK